MKKKLLSIVLAISMICAFVPLVVSAETTATSGTCGDNVTWTLSDDGTLTISGTGDMDSSDFSRYDIKSVIIENGVTSIGNAAFQLCSKLTSIEIPNSVTSIGDRAFQLCNDLTSIEIPDSVTSIGNAAFKWCFNLTNVEFSNSLTQIGNYAFLECESLTNIEIPDSVTEIGDGAFAYCYGLISINVDKDNPKFCSVDGNLFNKDKTELIQYAIGKNEKSYIVPTGVMTIGDYAFNRCKSLTSIEIPSSVTSIGDNALLNCSVLTSINVNKDNPKFCSIDGNLFSKDKTELIQYAAGKYESYIVPTGVTKIGANAFYDCYGLSGIELPDSVTSIGDSAFFCCESLTSIKIPNSVTSIGDYAFHSCESLTSIEIPNSITSIGDSVFSDCIGLTSIEIPNSVTSIGNSVFFDCTGLTSIEIPNSITSIGDHAFSDCTGLTSIEIPNSVPSIGFGAFYGCTELTSIGIPCSVTSIEGCAFSDCTNLTDVYYSGTKEQWNEIYISSESNDDLKNATIHYKRNLPITTATITKEETSEAYTFNVEPEQKYEDCYVYAAMYDENGLLTGFNRVPLETSGSTNISVGKTDNAESAKVFVLSDMLQPVIQAQEFNIE